MTDLWSAVRGPKDLPSPPRLVEGHDKAHSARHIATFKHARPLGLGLLIRIFMSLGGGGVAAAESMDCYPNCDQPSVAFILAEADYEAYRAKREAARAERDAARAERDAANAKRRMLEAKRRDRRDGEKRARSNLKKLQRKLKEGERKSGYSSYD